MSEFYFIEAEANSDKEAIKLCADVLHKNGCVLDDFYNRKRKHLSYRIN